LIRLQRPAVFLLILLIVLSGAIDAWAGRGSYFEADSVSYMDMAKGVAGGQPGAAINGYWSPLYPLILSLFIHFAEPDMTKEFAIVRVVNFLIFLVTRRIPCLCEAFSGSRQPSCANRRCVLREFASLWIIGVFGVAVYLPVTVRPRYLAPFLCLILLLLIGAVRISSKSRVRPSGGGIALVCLLASFLSCGPRLASAAELLIRTRGNVHDGNWRVAETFAALGAEPGTPVASIGPAFAAIGWARLASLRIVAQIRDKDAGRPTGNADRFRESGPALQEAVEQAFAQNGALFVIANDVPPWADTHG
jgi:hypothetical protein